MQKWFSGAARCAARLGFLVFALFGIEEIQAKEVTLPLALPSMSIGDATVVEGDSGVRTMTFRVSLSSPATTTVFFDRSTGGGTATGNVDYMSSFGNGWSIGAGESFIDLQISVYGDSQVESDETFQLTLSNVSGATLVDGVGVGKILNDDGGANKPHLNVGDVSIVEGDSGTRIAVFVVQLSQPAPSPVEFDVQTQNGSAVSNLDYVNELFNHRTIAAGDMSQAVMVTINGDKTVEPNETFTLNVLNVSGAYVNDDTATGTIVNDDGVEGPSLSVNDVSVSEGNSGTKTATFTVTLSAPLAVAASFDIQTANDTATADADYVATGISGLSIPAGQTSKTFAVTIKGDTIFEQDETFTVNLSNPVNTNVFDGEGVGTITNDDVNPTPTISIGDTSVLEGNSSGNQLVYTVSLDHAWANDVGFSVQTQGGTASGLDYTPTVMRNLAIPAGQTTATFSVSLVGDTVPEPDETVNAVISDLVGGAIYGDGEGVGTIINDDTSGPTVSIGDVSIAEGDSGQKMAVFTVALTAPLSWELWFDIATANGTATAGSDYVAFSQQAARMEPGWTSRTFEIAINGDGIEEANETFTVNLSRVSGAVVADGSATGTIVNDDGTTTPSLAIGDVLVTEGNSGTKTANFVVSLSSAAPSPVSFNVATSNATATAGSDYTAVSLSGQTIAAGQTSKTISVTVKGDTTVEPDEIFNVTVSGVTGATIADDNAVGTIANDDGSGTGPTLSIGDVSVSEGNSGSKTATFTVSLSAASANAVTYDVATGNGTATAGSDYVAKGTTGVSIAAGATSKTFTVTINGDTTPEPDENFVVNLTNPVGATISDGQALGVITNDDGAPVPAISVSDGSLVEGNAGTSFMEFEITMSAPASSLVTFEAGTADGSASAASDYGTQSWGLNFPIGSTSLAVMVPIMGDTIVEGDETFTVVLSNVNGATLADAQGVGTIINDDSGGSTPTLSIGDVSITEGNSGSKLATFTLTLSAPAATAVTYNIATAPGTATAPADFVNKSQTAQSIAAGQTSKTFTVSIKGDTVTEPDENFFVNVTSVTGATLADGQALGTITNDDGVAAPTLSIADVSISEGNSGTKTATFTVSLSAAAAGAVSYDIATSNGTATAGSDYVASSLTGQSITAGQTSKTFSVTINGDTTVESDETFTVTLSNPTGATIADGSAIGTITNDDVAGTPTLSIGDVSISEGNSGTKTATFTVSLSAAAAGAVTYDIATSNGTATAGSDYVAASLTGQSIAAGQTSQTFSITINGDTTVETDETFTVTLSNPTGATIADGSATGTITNDDSAGGSTLSIGDVSISEGNSGSKLATFTLTLSAPASTTVTYNIATAAGTATAPADFVNKSQTAQSIAAGQTSKTFTVSIKGDTVTEPDENFFVNVTNVTGATLADGQAVGTITNDDGAPVEFQFHDMNWVDEGNSGTKAFIFTVTLSAAAAAPVTFNIATQDVTAVAGSDYVALNLTNQSIPAGQTSKSFEIIINGDTTIEPQEQLKILISNVSGAVTDGPGEASLFITNDDGAASPSISIADVSGSEGHSDGFVMSFQVFLSQPADHPVTFDIATSDGTATAGSDYIASSLTSVTIPALQQAATFFVTLKGDTVEEPDETFFVTLSNVVGATVSDGQAVGTIQNDDIVRSLSIGDVSISEGDSGFKFVTFTVNLSGPATSGVTFNIATSDGTATAGSDYVAFNSSGLFSVSQSSQAFTIKVNGDTTIETDETFFVNVSNVVGATVADAQAIGTIQNDDSPPIPTLSIEDVLVSEGNSGTKTATFTVNLSSAAATAVTYDISTGDGSASAGSDYVASSLIGQSIAAGQISKTFSVTINGDTTVESDEKFVVMLTNPTGATMADDQAIGTIINDDNGGGSVLSISDVTMAEGNALNTQFSFTVSLSAAASSTVSFNIATADITALAGTDYTAKSMSAQTIAAGQTSKSFVVLVKGDRTVEPNETFLVNITGVTGAMLGDGQAIGTITNDDAGLVTVARFATGGLFDDIDDGNRAPLLTRDEYALLLLDMAQRLCRRADMATVVAVEDVENRAVLAELADIANASCANASRYTAVMADGDDRGFLVQAPGGADARGVQVLGVPNRVPQVGVTGLTVIGSGHATPITVLLASPLAGTPKQRALQSRALAQLLAKHSGEPVVVLNADETDGLLDLGLRAAAGSMSDTRNTKPKERIQVNRTLLRQYSSSRVELVPLPANEPLAPVLQLRQ